MNPKLEKLQKLFSLLKEDTISPTQLKDMVAVMVAVVKKSRDENQQVSEDLKTTLNETLAYLSKENNKTLKNAEGLNELKIKRLEKMVSDTLKTAQDALREVKSIEVMDGADADSEEIIKEVLKKIPKVEKVILDDRKKIVDKINSGGTEKINATEITGLPEFTREVVREVGSVGHIETQLKAGANITITTDGSGAKVITGSASGGGIALTDLSAGTGISYDNTTGVITNSAPDQTVAITAGTNITSVTGTYPNFTINASTQAGGAGDVVGPATHAASYIPQWNATPNSKTLVEGVAMPAGGLAGLTALGDKVDKVVGSRLITTAEGTILGNTSNTNTGDNTVATALTAQYIDWNSASGATSIANKPTIPTVGTWGALAYPTWASGTPFVKMTAAGTFALDTTAYVSGTPWTSAGYYVGDGSAFATSAHNHTGVYAPVLGADDNYVTDAQLVVIGNTSGTNSGDNSANTTYTIGSQTQAYNANLTAINQALTTTSSPSFTTVTAALTGTASGNLPLAGGTMTGGLVLVAGTTTVQPLKMVAGTNLTTPVTGVFEYDGTSLFFTIA